MSEQPVSVEEKWVPVLGFEGLYEASTEGRVRSLDRLGRASHRGGVRLHKGRVLKPGLNARLGYWLVALSKDGVAHTHNVHRIISTSFLGPRPEGMDVAHIDGDRANNSLKNLMYCSRAENLGHMVGHGTRLAGERHYAAVLSNNDIVDIRWLSSMGVKGKDLAAEYGVDHSHISRIKRGLNRVSVSEIGGRHLN